VILEYFVYFIRAIDSRSLFAVKFVMGRFFAIFDGKVFFYILITKRPFHYKERICGLSF